MRSWRPVWSPNGNHIFQFDQSSGIIGSSNETDTSKGFKIRGTSNSRVDSQHTKRLGMESNFGHRVGTENDGPGSINVVCRGFGEDSGMMMMMMMMMKLVLPYPDFNYSRRTISGHHEG